MLNLIKQIIKIKYKFLYIYISFFLLFISLFSFLFIYQSTKNENIELIVIDGENSIAPSFTSTTLTGDKYILDFNNQNPTIITFWASWCPPCREELPILENISKENQNIRILGVNGTNIVALSYPKQCFMYSITKLQYNHVHCTSNVTGM